MREEEAFEALRKSDPTADGMPKLKIVKDNPRKKWFLGASFGLVALSGLMVGLVAGPENSDAINEVPGIAQKVPGGGESSVRAAAPTEASSGKMASDMMPYYAYDKTVFSSEGLPSERQSAEAWGFDASSVFTQETLERVAAAVGMQIESTSNEWGMWSAIGADGSNLSLQADAMGMVNYYSNFQAYGCAPVDIMPTPDAKSSNGEGPEVMPAPMEDLVMPPAEDCQTPVNSVSASDAEERARALLTQLGLDPAAYVITSTSDEYATSVEAKLPPPLNDSGVSWYISYTDAGLQSLYGPLASLVSLGQYPVISPSEAAERLNDNRFPGENVYAYTMDGDASVAVEADVMPSPAAVPPAAPTAGDPILWPVREVLLTQWETTTTSYLTPSGVSYVLPAYNLKNAEGETWKVMAVAEEALLFNDSQS